jgi:hypothetical protein
MSRYFRIPNSPLFELTRNSTRRPLFFRFPFGCVEEGEKDESKTLLENHGQGCGGLHGEESGTDPIEKTRRTSHRTRLTLSNFAFRLVAELEGNAHSCASGVVCSVLFNASLIPAVIFNISPSASRRTPLRNETG